MGQSDRLDIFEALGGVVEEVNEGFLGQFKIRVEDGGEERVDRRRSFGEGREDFSLG